MYKLYTTQPTRVFSWLTCFHDTRLGSFNKSPSKWVFSTTNLGAVRAPQLLGILVGILPYPKLKNFEIIWVWPPPSNIFSIGDP